MPLQVCYSMTINKSQVQSLERVGLFLPNPVFTHGHLYVAFSRVTSPEGLKVFIDSPTCSSTNITRNVVYKEVFYNLPVEEWNNIFVIAYLDGSEFVIHFWRSHFVMSFLYVTIMKVCYLWYSPLTIFWLFRFQLKFEFSSNYW